jgi:methylenetetrahydrofolate--tRNA-(uracil-5-)-methyltransferase
VSHVSRAGRGNFQPMNINFGLFPPWEGRVPKKQRGTLYAQRALEDLKNWMEAEGLAAE